MDDAVRVGVGQRLADLVGDPQRVCQRRAVSGADAISPSTSPPAISSADQIGLARLLAHVVERDDVWMVAEPAHQPGLAPDALDAGLVEPLGLDQGEGHVAIEPRVGHR